MLPAVGIAGGVVLMMVLLALQEIICVYGAIRYKWNPSLLIATAKYDVEPE